jgi:hypothetical protein
VAAFPARVLARFATAGLVPCPCGAVSLVAGIEPATRDSAGGSDRAKGRGAVGPLAVPASLRSLLSALRWSGAARCGPSTPRRASAARCPPPPAPSPLQAMGGFAPAPPLRRAPASRPRPATPRRYHGFMVSVVPGTAGWRATMIAARSTLGTRMARGANVGPNPGRASRNPLIALSDTSFTVSRRSQKPPVSERRVVSASCGRLLLGGVSLLRGRTCRLSDCDNVADNSVRWLKP